MCSGRGCQFFATQMNLNKKKKMIENSKTTRVRRRRSWMHKHICTAMLHVSVVVAARHMKSTSGKFNYPTYFFSFNFSSCKWPSRCLCRSACACCLLTLAAHWLTLHSPVRIELSVRCWSVSERWVCVCERALIRRWQRWQQWLGQREKAKI